MSFERFGHTWDDGALDMIPGDGDNVGFLGQERTWVVRDVDNVPVSIHAKVCLEISVEAGVNEINHQILRINERIADLQAALARLEARRDEILAAE